MPSQAVFEFDRPDPVYYSGETINGRVNLTTTSEKSVREVYIKFHGAAKVRWEEQKSRTENGKTTHYTEYYRGSETYVESRTKVFNEGTLPAGTYTYNFSIPLPLQCPSSCVELHGHIRYEISLTLNRPFRFDNVYTQPVTVIKHLDLNQNPEYLIPLTYEEVKYFCCWPCSSGPVISNLLIPFGGYAPGQSIHFTLEVDNQSHGYDLNGIEFKLEQRYRFVASSPHHDTNHQSNTLASDRHVEKVRRLSKRIIKGTLLIPSVPPSSMQDNIITVRYIFKIFIKTGDCHHDIAFDVPIVIGTVPLYQSAENPQSVIVLPQPTAPDTPPTAGSYEDKPPAYGLLKPPSYEDATAMGGQFIDTDVDEHQRVDGFKPKYPMFNNFAIPTAPAIEENQEIITHKNQMENMAAVPAVNSQVPLLQTTENSANVSNAESTTASSLPYPVSGAGMPVLPTNAAASIWKH